MKIKQITFLNNNKGFGEKTHRGQLSTVSRIGRCCLSAQRSATLLNRNNPAYRHESDKTAAIKELRKLNNHRGSAPYFDFSRRWRRRATFNWETELTKRLQNMPCV